MHFHRLDLNLLLVLDALLAECNTTRAAQRLNLSQSATSNALGRLRGYFGDELLIPAGRTMVMTSLAVSLQQPVRATLQQLRAALDVKPSFVPERSDRHFRVVASEYATGVLLAKAIQVIAERAPGITIEILPLSEDCGEQISRGKADLAVLSAQFVIDDLRREVVIEDDYACLAWTGNRRVGEALTREQYLELGHVSRPFGCAVSCLGRSLIDTILIGANMPRRVEVWANSFDTIPLLLMNTNRIATLNTRLAELYARHFPLRLLTMPIEMPRLVEHMQWNKMFDNDPALLWLRCLLKEVAELEGLLATPSDGLPVTPAALGQRAPALAEAS